MSDRHHHGHVPTMRSPLPGWKPGAPRLLSEVLGAHLPARLAIAAVPWLAPAGEVLELAEAAQRAVDRLCLGAGEESGPLTLLTTVGVRALGSLAVTRTASPGECRRVARAYAGQRCDARAASLFAHALEFDRRRHRMALRDLA